MKKIIISIVILPLFFLVLNINVNVRAQTYTADNEMISFGSYENYEEFKSSLSINDKINVLVKLSDDNYIENYSYINEVLSVFEDNYYYNSKYVPLFIVYFDSKVKFLNNYELLIGVLNDVDFEWALIDKYKEMTQEISSINNELYYDWNQALKDVGLETNNDFIIKNSINIGILEWGGIPNLSNEYFQNNDIDYYVYEQKSETDHATVVTYIISEIAKNIDDTNIYISKYDDKKIIEILDWYVEHEVNVVNLSWGYGKNTINLYCKYDAFFDFYSYYTGIIFINSAGNTGDKITPPGRAYNIITVGAVNKNLEIVESSSYVSFNKKPTVVAPGYMLTNMYESIPYCDNSLEYPFNSGTSFATPIVTGIVSLLIAEFSDIASDVKTITTLLIASSNKLDIENSTYSENSGFGMVNYLKARELILTNNVFKILEKNNQYSKEFEIDSYYSKELYFVTMASCMNIDCDLDSYQQPTNVILPSLKISIFDDSNKKVYEEVISDSITNTKISNFTNERKKYIIIIENYNEENLINLSCAFKDYGNYVLKSYNEYEHIFQSNLDIVEMEHCYEYTEEYAQCKMCDYHKEMDEIVISDPDQWTIAGTEVTVNGGNYRGTSITQGFTRLLFFDSQIAPSLSRLDYYWYSSNENAAIVSEYGTVTALNIVETCWVTITAVYKYDTEIKLYKKLQILHDTSDIIRSIDYTISMKSTEKKVFKLDEKAPTTSLLNYSFSVPCQEDESAGVKISKWGTITAVAPGTMYIVGFYDLNPNIIITIKVVVT